MNEHNHDFHVHVRTNNIKTIEKYFKVLSLQHNGRPIMISITNHDSLEIFNRTYLPIDIIELGKEYNIKIVKGVTVKCTDSEHLELSILAPSSNFEENYIDNIIIAKLDRLIRILTNLKEYDIYVDPNELLKYCGGKKYKHLHLIDDSAIICEITELNGGNEEDAKRLFYECDVKERIEECGRSIVDIKKFKPKRICMIDPPIDCIDRFNSFVDGLILNGDLISKYRDYLDTYPHLIIKYGSGLIIE